MANSAEVLTFLLVDIVTDRCIVWLKVISIFRDAIIHIMDNVNLLNLKEHLKSNGSSLSELYLYLFLIYSNGKLVSGL